MSTALAERTVDAALFERVLIHGDLKQLTPAQKVSYYKAVCESVGLNPLTQPFQYIVLNGKEVLYATRAATEQLRQVHAVSVSIMAREVVEDCYVVTARASLPTGRQDENIGVVPIANLKGENRANAMMKAETKAKRRVTLAICGLGMLDETEVASIQPTYTVSAPDRGEAGDSAVSSTVASSTPRPPASALPPVTMRPAGARPEDDSNGFPVGADTLTVREVKRLKTKNANVTKYVVVLSDGREVSTIKDQLATLAEQCCQDGDPVTVDTASSKWGEDLTAIHRVEREIQMHDDGINPDDPLPF
jgi:hypothetical protein